MNRILLVDDEPNALQAYRRSLRRRFKVDTALGAREALEAVRCRGPYAVIVADVRMPEMTGIELLSEIRKMSPDTIRIVLTGNADRQTATDAFERGQVFCCLSKPCAPQTLAAALEAGLAQYSLVATNPTAIFVSTANGEAEHSEADPFANNVGPSLDINSQINQS